MKWINKKISRVKLCEVAKKYNISELLAQVLLNRDFTLEELDILTNKIHEAILDPNDFTNCNEAAQLINSYLLDDNALIIIRADYDADGITSGYVMGDGLKQIAKCEVLISFPERSEGYGLKMAFCDEVIKLTSEKHYSQVLLITVDNGIASIDEINHLKANNINVLVTDHHQPKATLPDCLIVDPWKDDVTTFQHLCGVGVAFKVIQSLYRLHDKEADLNKYLSAVAIGTIADMMPMSLENIAFAVYGLEQMNSEDCNLGIQALKEYLGKSNFTFSDIGWEIGPRINACGRMGNTQLAAKLFFNEELSYDDIMDNVVIEIDKLNTERKTKTNEFLNQALKQVDDTHSIIVVSLKNCIEGLAGVVVNKLIGIYNRPCIVLTESDDNDILVGSARSVGNINILEILTIEQISHHTLNEFGGHEQAAGLSLSKNNLKSFINHLSHLPIDIQTSDEDKVLYIDSNLTLQDLTYENYNNINIIPYDKTQLIEPVFEIEANVLNYKYTTKKDKLWLFINDYTTQSKEYKLLLFGDQMDLFLSLCNKDKIRIAGTLATDFLNNHKTITLRIIDMKECC